MIRKYFVKLINDQSFDTNDLSSLDVIAEKYKSSADAWVKCFINYPTLLTNEDEFIKIGKTVNKGEFFIKSIQIDTKLLNKGSYILAYDLYSDKGNLIGETFFIYINKE